MRTKLMLGAIAGPLAFLLLLLLAWPNPALSDSGKGDVVDEVDADFIRGQLEPADMRVFVISDLNGSYGSIEYHRPVRRAVQLLLALEPDLVISTGDMVAGQRRPPLKGPRIKKMWQRFHQEVTHPLMAMEIPFAVTPGNHDASFYKTFHMERAIYKDEWLRRAPDVHYIDRSGYPFNYAFSMGDALFISLDVTGVGKLPDRQKRWLRHILERHAPHYRHRIVFSHVPMWPFAHGRETEVTMDFALENILQSNRVDLYLSGHHHAYYPGFKDGIRYISQACLGGGPRPVIGTKQRSKRAITVIGLNHDGSISVQAIKGPDYIHLLSVTKLPPKIQFEGGELTRLDLVMRSGRLKNKKKRP